eukprot:TRINITY_DN76822_c0_g1_i1.p1 TRINITY_DN76822_c0_g1~~TRINITY_DN76822_c0_g1_i1.p1  ORF type:complete len:424 (-),score=96.66 TRINITY_DN76822_c0_g1_i1:13-1245(-)
MGCGSSVGGKYAEKKEAKDEVVAVEEKTDDGESSSKKQGEKKPPEESSKEKAQPSKAEVAKNLQLESIKAMLDRVERLEFGEVLQVPEISSAYFFSETMLSRRTKVVIRLVTCRTTGRVRAAKQHTLRKVPGGRLNRSPDTIKKQALMHSCFQHPNIVRLLEVFISQSTLYEILEYCNGGRLYETIVDSEGLTEREAANSLQQVVNAVAYMHQRRIAHRDVKPEHVVLRYPCAVLNAKMVLVDFSTACVFSSAFMNEQVSTPFYAAPQIFESRYTQACDVWSLGVMLYVLLLGYPKKMEALLKDPAIKPKELHTFITRGKLVIDPNFRDRLSSGAADLLSSLLSIEESGRPSAQEASDNIWLCYQAPLPDLSPEQMMAQTTARGEVFDRAGHRMLVKSSNDELQVEDVLC